MSYKHLEISGTFEQVENAVNAIREANADDGYFVKPQRNIIRQKVLTPAVYDSEGNEATPATYSEEYYAYLVLRDEAQLTAAISIGEGEGANAIEHNA